MALPNVFDPKVSGDIINRINNLTPQSKAQWGKMNVAQMLAHCNVTYEMVYQDKHKRPGFFMKWILKKMAKETVTNETPYKQNNRTAPQFIIVDEKDFGQEKGRLINHIRQTTEKGAAYFDGRESHSFGTLNATEWNNMFYKHLDHHLRQFGV